MWLNITLDPHSLGTETSLDTDLIPSMHFHCQGDVFTEGVYSGLQFDRPFRTGYGPKSLFTF